MRDCCKRRPVCVLRTAENALGEGDRVWGGERDAILGRSPQEDRVPLPATCPVQHETPQEVTPKSTRWCQSPDTHLHSLAATTRWESQCVG